MLKTTNNWGSKNKYTNDLDPYDINDYFASVATDTAYNRADVLQASKTRQHPLTPRTSQRPYSRDAIKMLLANVRKTSPGNDRIPYWVFRDFAEGLSQVVTKLTNYSLSIGKVSSAWKIAAVTPVLKTNPVLIPSYLKPISVTPILSRLVERLVIRDLIMPNVSPANLYD